MKVMEETNEWHRKMQRHERDEHGLSLKKSIYYLFKSICVAYLNSNLATIRLDLKAKTLKEIFFKNISKWDRRKHLRIWLKSVFRETIKECVEGYSQKKKWKINKLYYYKLQVLQHYCRTWLWCEAPFGEPVGYCQARICQLIVDCCPWSWRARPRKVWSRFQTGCRVQQSRYPEREEKSKRSLTDSY